MRRRIGIVLLMVFLIPGLILTLGCAKKQVKPDEPVAMDDGKTMEDEAMAAEEDAKRKALEEQELLERQKRQREMEMAARAKFGAKDIYFDFDSSALKPSAQATLREKAAFLRSRPNASVIIEGHCDERGTAEYNLALGERRAEAAKAFLMNLGISGSRMTTISYGEEKPVAMGHNEQTWAKNRRAHFEIR